MISNQSKPYFIADIAANHDGSLDRARMLIELAAKAGAHAAKFQHFRAEHIVSDHGFKELGSKLAHQSSWKESVYEVYKSASLPWTWTPILKQTADACGIDFFTATYDLEAIDHVNDFVPAFKIGSGDINWHESIKVMIKKKKPIIVATGASMLKEVEEVYQLLTREHASFVIMQCNTNYSGDINNIKFSNLLALNQFKEMFPEAVLGLSDHTPGDITVLGAISLGARVIEKHFTDNTERVGPDHKFSMDPKTWREMISRSSLLFESLGDGIKKVEENEVQARVVQRRAIRYNRKLRAGQILSRNDITVLRPAPRNSIPPNLIYDIVGRKLIKNVEANQISTLDDFEPLKAKTNL